MVNDFIQLRRDQSAATEVSELLQYIDALRHAYEIGVRVRAKMQHSFDDGDGENSIDWSTLETLWGVPVKLNGETPISVGPDANGAVIYTLVNGSIGAMEGTFQNNECKVLTERVG